MPSQPAHPSSLEARKPGPGWETLLGSEHVSQQKREGSHPRWKDPLVWRQEGGTRQGARKTPGKSGAQTGGSLPRVKKSYLCRASAGRDSANARPPCLKPLTKELPGATPAPRGPGPRNTG